jgi:lactate dehydrogenase-like 2-hydroxyacid dehydrogenase
MKANGTSMTSMVFLDTATIGKVNNMKMLAKMGDLETHESTLPEEVVDRCLGKEIVIVNKVEMTAEVMKQLPDLKLICVAATGVNNVDLNYAQNNSIEVKNVAGYSTDSVAQRQCGRKPRGGRPDRLSLVPGGMPGFAMGALTTPESRWL